MFIFTVAAEYLTESGEMLHEKIAIVNSLREAYDCIHNEKVRQYGHDYVVVPDEANTDTRLNFRVCRYGSNVGIGDYFTITTHEVREVR